MTDPRILRAPLPPGHYRLRGVLASEWTKLRSVRSTTVSLAVTVVLTIAIGMIATSVVAARWPHLSVVDRLRFDPVAQSLTGLIFSQLAIGVLGILVVTAEYSSGTIRATFSAVPNRALVLSAKTAVFGVVALLVSEAVSFAAFFIGQAFFHGPPFSGATSGLLGSALITAPPHASLGGPGVLRAVMGSGVYLTLLGLFALGIAAIIRHTAGAISTFVAVLLILPLILQALPQSVIDAVGKFLPATIGVAMTSASDRNFTDAHPFGPWVGIGLLAGYAALALLIGGWLMVRRDA